MDDLISRQAAIDAIYETFCYAYCDNCEREMNEDLCGDCHRKYQNWAASKKAVESAINSVPSAQSEIIYCKDCTRYEKKNGRCNLVEGLNVATANSFCSYGEKK